MNAVVTRFATPADAAGAVAVLRASITQLCELDHQSDALTLDRWLSNKTVENFLTWLADPDSRIVVAELEPAIAGVAAIHRSGEVRLCYVRPDATRLGVGRGMLMAIEAQARQWGINRLDLRSSLTARSFYERCGYVSAGPSVASYGVLRAYPYAKILDAKAPA